MIFHTPNKLLEGIGAIGSSPWKIKVTVEAEPEEQEQNVDRATSMTMTVPLKHEDEQNRVRRIRRRIPVGLDSPATEHGRTVQEDLVVASPRRTTRRSTTNVSVTAGTVGETLDAAVTTPTTDATGATPSKRRGRPRKNLGTAGSPVPLIDEVQPAAAIPKRMTRMNFAALTPLHKKPENALTLDSSALLTPATQKRAQVAAAARKIRDRIPTPRKPAGYDESILSPLPASSPPIPSRQNGDDVPAHNYENSEANEKSTINEAAFTSDVEMGDQEEDDMVTGLEDDTTMLDRSVVESEDFSMVSIDSLRNQRMAAERRVHDTNMSSATNNLSTSTEEVKSKTVTVEQRTTRRSVLLSSPARPAPDREPQQIVVSAMENVQMSSRSPVKTYSPKSASKRQYTIMVPLGSSPIASTEKTTKSPVRAQRQSDKRKNNDSELFSPFGAGTKRQLRAELVKGELLARGQKGFLKETTEHQVASNNDSTPENLGDSTANAVAYPRLPTPAESVDSIGAEAAQDKNIETRQQTPEAEVPEPQTFLSSPPTSRSHDHSDEIDTQVHSSPSAPERSELNHTQQLEQVFHKERQEVARQIREANTSQVIVINSDDDRGQDDHVGHDDGQQDNHVDHNGGEQQTEIQEEAQKAVPSEPILADIWQEEADRSVTDTIAARNKRRKRKQQEVDEQTPDLRDLFVEDLRPPRAKIPRTWRRVSGNDFLYSDEVETPAPAPVESNVNAQQSGSVHRQSPTRVTETQKEDANENPSHSRPERTKFTKGVLRSPLAQRSPARSPAKEVHFTQKEGPRKTTPHQGNNGNARENEEDFSASEGADGSSVGNPDKTVYGEDSFTSTDEGSSLLQTSDVKQLRSELKASTVRRSSSFFDSNHGSNMQRNDNDQSEHSILRPIATKKYAPLFESEWASRKSQNDTEPSSKQPKPLPQIPTQPRKTTSTINIPQTAPQNPTTFLTRLTSWLFRPSLPLSLAHFPPTTINTQHTQKNTNNLPWNRNHYLLLNHYWLLTSPNPPSNKPGPPLPATYNTTPLSSLPANLTRYLGKEIFEKRGSGENAGLVTERWIRVSWVFMEEARLKGVPLICDGALVPKSGGGGASGYPKRDEEGRVLTVKEMWGGWDVLRRVYGLWVRDECGPPQA